MKTMLAALVAIFCAISPVYAQEDYSEDDIARAMDFALGDAAYTMYHEIGHLLVNELGVPVLGKEEDAADALAVLMLLNDDSDDNSYVRLIDAADGWYFKAQNSQISGMADLAYYDEHSLNIQRAYAMACLMLGKDQDYFSNVGDFYNIDQDQRDSCAYTYEQTETAWDTLLQPYLRTGGAGSSIDVIYEEPNEGYEAYAKILEDAEILEHAAELVSAKYLLPRPVTFRAKNCDEANAWYSHDGEVTYCYEVAEEMANLYLSDVRQFYADDDEDASDAEAGEE